jgi:hypothetical protein
MKYPTPSVLFVCSRLAVGCLALGCPGVKQTTSTATS